MKISKGLQERINVLFPNDDDLRGKLLEGDANTISYVGSESQKGMNPQKIVDAIESGDEEAMKNLYNEAKRLLDLKKLYEDLWNAYYKSYIRDNQANRRDDEER